MIRRLFPNRKAQRTLRRIAMHYNSTDVHKRIALRRAHRTWR